LHLNGSTNPTIIGIVPPPRASKEVTFDPEVVKEVKSKYFSLFSKYYDTAAMEEYVGKYQRAFERHFADPCRQDLEISSG